MFEQILQAVKEHLGNNPELAAAIPPEHAEALHNEIATQIHENLQNQASAAGQTAPAAEGSGLLDNLGGKASELLHSIEGSLSSGGIGTSAAAGGLVGALSSKFGLPSAVTGAIAAAVPGLIQKFMQKQTPATPTTPQS
ncbi:MAG: hypothetical protein J0H74_21150 [Chitinophagaceae bacterium]|nr:hypothetical protein [Chitinophagaceae bacterium]